MYATTVILHVLSPREHRNDGTEVQAQEGRVVFLLDHLLVQSMGRELAVATQQQRCNASSITSRTSCGRNSWRGDNGKHREPGDHSTAAPASANCRAGSS